MTEIILTQLNSIMILHNSLLTNIGSSIHVFQTDTDYSQIRIGLVGMGAGMATTGCLGAGIGQGFAAGKAAEAIGRNPESASKVRTIMIIGAAIAESGAIYSLLVAIILLFVYNNVA